MKRLVFLTVVSGFLLLPACRNSADSPSEYVTISRGICVILGDIDGKVFSDLASGTELLLYVQLEDHEAVKAVRQLADSQGILGHRAWIEQGSFDRIHLANNIADSLVAVGAAADRVSQAEVLRVLCPRGMAFVGTKKLVKPLLDGADDWSHPYHGPDNNPQSEDQLAKAPYLTQFLAKPYYAPLTQVAVASAGRVFKAFGNIAFHLREEAFLNSLVAFNGYNGTMLWRRKLTPGVMIHRNTMIATPDVLYVGDDKSCKLIDTETGRLIRELVPPIEAAGGTFWKWMALEGGVLYALIGEQEQKDPVTRQRRQVHGWPWDPLTKGFNQEQHPWGFGRNLLALDPENGSVLWRHQEQEPVDARALAMKNGRIFIYRHGGFLACLESETGETLWRLTPSTSPELFSSLGPYLDRQGAPTNWRTTNYMKCDDKAIYFAGPMIDKLLAVSADEGRVLWQHPYDNFQLVLRDDGMYAISGQRDEYDSLKFDRHTGEVLERIDTRRRACTRPSGSIDSVFFRAPGGSVRLDTDLSDPQWISPMRAQCHDGVTIANGLLYWWPSTCDCHNILYGVTSLGPAGDFDFDQVANEESRLQMGDGDIERVAEVSESESDWPTFRGNNSRTATSDATVSADTRRLWWFTPETAFTPTAPVVVGDMTFFSGLDGIVRALNTQSGELIWKAYTGGAVRFPPTVWQNRVYVGSGDGWVYAFEAANGRLLWRFKAAPQDRKIPFYDTLMSTWPVASGVLVEEGVAYFAAGILNYDGVHVYALDAVTGKIKWQNNTSGHLDPESRTGVSVQGHLLLQDGRLYLAGGTSVSPAVYDIETGKCLNDSSPLELNRAASPRGQELYRLGEQVLVGGKPLYADPDYPVYDQTVFNKVLHSSAGNLDILWINSSKIACYERLDRLQLEKAIADPLIASFSVRGSLPKFSLLGKPLWERDCEGSMAFARSQNVVLFAGTAPHGLPTLEALDVKTGQRLWRQGVRLQSPPVPWGLAVDGKGRIVASLRDGQVMGFGPGTE